MTEEEFVALYEKFLLSDCTADEIEMLYAYKDDIELADDTWEDAFSNKKEVYRRIHGHLVDSMGTKKRQLKFWWLSAAAAAIIVLLAGLLFINHKKPERNNNLKYAHVSDIKPGSDKAFLTLANGTRIILNDAKTGKIAQVAGMNVSKLNNGTLLYEVNPDKKGDVPAGVNTLTTPRGGKYQVVLADGTKVWLNASSSLKYESVFNGADRKVEILGEAYFEVAKNPDKPFKVLANGVSLRVLGTHFNVMARNADQEFKATLLEGSVKLTKANEVVILKPGEQGISNRVSAGFSVKEVDVDDILAWKNGLFAFKNERIEAIMDEISRWYDVDVEFRGDIQQKSFGGTVSRFKDISEVLKVLELTESVHFKIEGRRVIVMP